MNLPVSVVKNMAGIQRNFDWLSRKLFGIEAIVGGQATATAAGGVASADVTITDNLGTVNKKGVAVEHFPGSTYAADLCMVFVLSVTANTTTFRALTRLNGNIPAGNTVIINYLIWK